MDRVITYVDGFNLYFGLKTSGLGRCRWLNVQALASNLLLPSQQLVYTKYFTARIIDPEDKRKRQVVYLEALETLNSFNIFYGKYQRVEQSCRACGATRTERNEKMTDVNIAVEMLADAFQNKFDTAILISGDSDLTAPIELLSDVYFHTNVLWWHFRQIDVPLSCVKLQMLISRLTKDSLLIVCFSRKWLRLTDLFYNVRRNGAE